MKNTLRNYCVENNLFSRGSNYQYEAMFECNNIHDKAVIIWVCSNTTKSISDIENDLLNLESNF